MAAMDKVKKLHTALIDTVSGYEKAVEEAETAELKAVFENMIALRRAHHAELHRALVERGEAPGEDGSFMGIVHQTVIGVRAAVKGIGRDALDAFVQGEESILARYDDAIEATQRDPELPDLLRTQQSALRERVAEMKRLAS